MKTYSFGIKYKVGGRFIHTTATIQKNSTVPPTRSIKAKAAREAAHAASRQSRHTPTTTGTYVVAGAGTAGVNGLYIQTGTLNGQPQYTSTTEPAATLSFDGAKWVITGGPFNEYIGTASITGAYSTGGGSIGAAPAPTVALATSGSSFYVRAIDVTDPMLASQRRLKSVRDGKYAFCANTI